MECPIKMARRDALEEAARVLERNASLYQEAANNFRAEPGEELKLHAAIATDKARLLRTQATIIRLLS